MMDNEPGRCFASAWGSPPSGTIAYVLAERGWSCAELAALGDEQEDVIEGEDSDGKE